MRLIKNIERMGKTFYECIVIMFLSKKKFFLPNFNYGGRGEFECARVNPIPWQNGPLPHTTLSATGNLFEGEKNLGHYFLCSNS